MAYGYPTASRKRGQEPPNIDRVLDGFWGVDSLVESFRKLMEDAGREAEKGYPRRVRVWVEEQ